MSTCGGRAIIGARAAKVTSATDTHVEWVLVHSHRTQPGAGSRHSCDVVEQRLFEPGASAFEKEPHERTYYEYPM
eukprot:NODE_6790_length_483_cov_150.850467.p1 GENE.NODE_6790_length_483_cov_150.850467~~NODE_6790_length_483_cov_150.850467.p1  ORF type:complete len:75 (+),score=4.49 NODE_6790_length_483_cov_150.850467:208-432(+)